MTATCYLGVVDRNVIYSQIFVFSLIWLCALCRLQCFNSVGWASGRTSSM